MDKTEKLVFVRELMDSIENDIERKIVNNEIPDEWDGFELRQYIADKTDQSTYIMDRKRMHEYRNTILTTNL